MQQQGRNLIKKERRGFVISLAVFALLVVLAVALIGQVGQKVDVEQTARLEEALRRAAVTCYAVEGRYPATLDYLTQHYGVVVDNERFQVFYEVIAPNLMPSIHVVWLEGVVG